MVGRARVSVDRIIGVAVGWGKVAVNCTVVEVAWIGVVVVTILVGVAVGTSGVGLVTNGVGEISADVGANAEDGLVDMVAM